MTRKQAQELCFAMTAHATAMEKLNSGDMEGYNAWCRMRDQSLVEATGKTHEGLHAIGYK